MDIRLKVPLICVPSVDPAREELTPGREPWDRQCQQHLILPLETFSLLSGVNSLPPHLRDNPVS